MDNICIIATGGTIDKEHDPIAEKLVFSKKSYVPEMLMQCRAEKIPHQVLMLKDSEDMVPEDRETILQAVMARPERSVVVTHGTGTMSVSAEYMKGKTGDKTVVLTGALRPFSLFMSDAVFNMGCAIIAAQIAPPGVYITMNGEMFAAGTVRKNLATGFFERI